MELSVWSRSLELAFMNSGFWVIMMNMRFVTCVYIFIRHFQKKNDNAIRKNEDVIKKQKDNVFELYRFLNREFCIAHRNNSYASINFIKRDDDGQVSTKLTNFYALLKSNKILILLTDKASQQNLQHYLLWPQLQH